MPDTETKKADQKTDTSADSVLPERNQAQLKKGDEQNPTDPNLDESKTDDDREGMNIKWDDMLKRLLKFIGKTGHCLVPNRYPEDPRLGSWVSTQRRQYKVYSSGPKKSTSMTAERVSRLEEIGFQWSTKDPRHVPWDLRFDELLEFIVS
jgi:hypothetical protein